MPQIRRNDGPGAWHHVMNRGVGRRSLFDTDVQRRYFLSLVAAAVRDDGIRVHAYSLLSTHFHMLVESCDGRLSAAMHRIESRYAKAFNSHNDRDGPLVRNRFKSKPVTDLEYRLVLVGYIDWNVVDAGLAARPEDWAYGSAHCYVHSSHPTWLERSWVEEHVAARTTFGRFDTQAYREIFLPTRPQRELIDLRIASRATRDPLHRLNRADSEDVRAWLLERARIADATPPILPIAAPTAVLAACHHVTGETPIHLAGRPRLDARRPILVGLLRELCRLTHREIAIRANVHRASVHALLERHSELIATDGAYAHLAATTATLAIGTSVRHCISHRV